MEDPPLPGYWAEWIAPGNGFRGTHIYVTDGVYAFDFHGYTRLENLLTHYWRDHQKLFQGWSATIERVAFSLLDTRELNARKHLGPDQYHMDPRPRAAQFIAGISRHPQRKSPDICQGFQKS